MKSSASPWCLPLHVSPRQVFVFLNLRHHRSGDNRFVKGHSSSIKILLLRKTVQSHGSVGSISDLVLLEFVLLKPDLKLRDIEG